MDRTCTGCSQAGNVFKDTPKIPVAPGLEVDSSRFGFIDDLPLGSRVLNRLQSGRAVHGGIGLGRHSGSVKPAE